MSEIQIYVNDRPPVTGTIEIGQTPIDVSSDLPKPDRRWTYIDDSGHFHAYSTGPRDGMEPYPTLRVISEHVDCDGACGGHCEGYSINRYFCLICDQEIHPGTVTHPWMERIPGPEWWTVTLEEAIPHALNSLVSVRVVYPAGGQLFGVATAQDTNYSRTAGGEIWARTTLAGAGPLGRRTG